MKHQDIIRKKRCTRRFLWILSTLFLSLILSGWSSLVCAEVTLCGEPLSPDSDGIYRLRGHLECSEDPILYIGEDGAEFDLRGFTATGDTTNGGIEVRANNVTIEGGIFRKCSTALYVNQVNNCEIEHFIAIDSSEKAIRFRGDGNIIRKSLCRKAGNDCFELRGDGPEGNTAEYCTAISSGTADELAQGFQFRGPGEAYKCFAIGSTAEGFQIQEGVSNVTIEGCLALHNAQGGIVIEAGATDNTVKHNFASKNGDGIDYFDLSDGNEECDSNTWDRNRFRSRNPADCIH